jgi:hypothetical protein
MKAEGWERKRYMHVDAITWMSNVIYECEKGIIPEGYEESTDLKKLASVLRECIKGRNQEIERINTKIKKLPRPQKHTTDKSSEK